MARKLKTFTTSGGFFDLAVAAPSMKAALEAWGAESNLFHQGFAKQTEDEEIIAATMAKPGLVLRRPVGTNAAFSEHAEFLLISAQASPPEHRQSPERRRPGRPRRSMTGRTARRPRHSSGSRSVAHGKHSGKRLPRRKKRSAETAP